MKIVIVGGVAGGATAAARARRLDERAEIVVFERGEYVSFANCGLPYHVGGAIPKRESLLLMTPAAFKARMAIDVRVKHEVLAIDRAAKRVSVKDLASGAVFEESYDKLILATGSRPLRPPIPGAESPEVLTLWTIDDMDKVIAKAKGGARSAAIIGGGFIGVELAENLRELGLDVTLVEMLPQVMPTLDMEMSQPLAAELRANGVSLRLGAQAASIESLPSGGFKLNLKEGVPVEAGLLVMSAGVRPNSELAKAAGLELGERGGVVVDESMRTSDPDIFAVGDMVQVKDLALDAPAMIPLAGPANKQGRVAATNALGGAELYRGSLGTSVCKVFNLTAASVGATERRLKQAGREFFKVYLHPFSHVNYYPGAEMMHVKALFGKDGLLLGAQIVGREGVDKRIDVLATALRHGLKAQDLAELELAYAPPYGAAKDPVNFIGFVAGNVMSGQTRLAYSDALPSDALLLDVRERAEVEAGTIPGSVNVPLGELRGRLGELPKDREIIPFCRVGSRSYHAELILRANGFKARNMSGAYLTWTMFNPPKDAPPPQPKGSAPASCSCVLPSASLASCALPQLSSERKLDVRGMQCPGPIVAVKKALEEMKEGEALVVSASDESFLRDLPAWCKSSGHSLLDVKRAGKLLEARLAKGAASSQPPQGAPQAKRATIVLFSNDLDKAMAAFIIASGFASLGNEVNIFCTFWGLNVLRKERPPEVSKDILSRLFGFMMPRGARKLALSKMHMLGMGTAMMKHVMATKNVDDLPALMKSAQGMGVKLLACEMAMNVMGIKKEELIDGVELAGVASFTGLAAQGGPALFI